MSTTLIANLKLGEIAAKATVHRTNFPFNSFCKMPDGTYIGASDTLGLCTIGGTTDNGVAISSVFEPIRTDFGLSNPKRIRRLYLTFEATKGKKIQILMTADEDSTTVQTIVFEAYKNGKQVVEMVTDRMPIGVFWSFTVSNINGADFAISRLEALVIVLSAGRLY